MSTSADLYLALGVAIESEPDERRRISLLNDLIRTADLNITANRVQDMFALWGHQACERGVHTPSNYNDPSGSPCERGCGVHVPWYPEID